VANPRLENGYTRIANELLEKIPQADLGALQLGLLLVVPRRSWGFSRKEVALSIGDFAAATGRDRSTISRTLARLKAQRILLEVQPAGFRSLAVVAVNKDWESWKVAWGVDPKPTVAVGSTVGVRATQQLTSEQYNSCSQDNPPLRNKEITPPPGAKERGKKGATEPPSASDEDPPPAFLEFEFPTNLSGETFAVSEEVIAELVSLYPGVDVRRECRRMLEWLQCNPGRRKTADGMPAFIHRWLKKERNEAGVGLRASPPAWKIERMAKVIGWAREAMVGSRDHSVSAVRRWTQGYCPEYGLAFDDKLFEAALEKIGGEFGGGNGDGERPRRYGR
jgi:phage replication O-like protein O